jgi:hypothetical protein
MMLESVNQTGPGEGISFGLMIGLEDLYIHFQAMALK